MLQPARLFTAALIAMALVGADARAATVNFFFSFDTATDGTGSYDNNVTADNYPGTPTVSKTFTVESTGNAGGTTFTDYQGTTWTGSGSSATPGHSLTWNPGSTGNSLSLTFSTLNLTDLSLRFDVRSGQAAGGSSPTGFNTFTYDIGGGEVAVGTLGPAFTPVGSYHAWSVDLSALDAIENQSSVTLKWTFDDLASSPGESMRIDNIQAAATIPTPAALPAGLAMLGLLVMRRK
ncbi:hypothetical protein HED60_13475 [Planctomycetales bacterium ZRK34]|nr:hypothetical protein HED60_13475 [Planctomycetales bacterium ZRK34]